MTLYAYHTKIFSIFVQILEYLNKDDQKFMAKKRKFIERMVNFLGDEFIGLVHRRRRG